MNTMLINEVSPDPWQQEDSGNRVPLAELIAEMRHQRDSARAETEQLKKANSKLLLKVAELTIRLAKSGSQVTPKPPVKPTLDTSEAEIARAKAMFGLK